MRSEVYACFKDKVLLKSKQVINRIIGSKADCNFAGRGTSKFD
ncbi:hypothetical protein HMPREF0765_1508 [Sphingobacterium spiritivorum ATCC 33300]|uniref:Uncharacterized protein n=1 Tax=Sphingobacterium spiritivorum ATCC 33300 TaxID=525372 RepID=C2FW02_SPHSI|nr:hypothetical protein HMPREF0765_1508 [Sphingobacterium spiritivorum ATCC 33300]